MLKLADNPPILTPDVESLTDLDGTWWVAHTKTHFEKSFAWDLYSRGIGYFLPMREYVNRSPIRRCCHREPWPNNPSSLLMVWQGLTDQG